MPIRYNGKMKSKRARPIRTTADLIPILLDEPSLKEDNRLIILDMQEYHDRHGVLTVQQRTRINDIYFKLILKPQIKLRETLKKNGKRTRPTTGAKARSS